MYDRELDALARLTRAVAAEPNLPLPLRMCQACVSILGVDGGSLAVIDADAERLSMLCATDRCARRLGDLQDVVGEGPGLAAYREGVVVRQLLDGRSEGQWQFFCGECHKEFAGFALHAFPVMSGPYSFGAATFYQRCPSPLFVDDRICQLLVNVVGVVLARNACAWEDEFLRDSSAWRCRPRIDEAIGMVMAQLGLSADDSLALLRAHAYAHGCTLSQTSNDIVARRLNLPTVEHNPQRWVP